MGDGDLAQTVFAAMIRARTAGVVDFALMYRAAMNGIVNVEVVTGAQIPQGISQPQRNALAFMKLFVPALIAKYAKPG
jgi:hypothetical protein